MRTIFGLFEDFPTAEEAVEALLQNDFDEDEMNVIVREQTAEQSMTEDIDLKAVSVQKSDEVASRKVHGLARLLGGEQPVPMPDVGPVLAGGELATIMANRGSSTWDPEDALVDVLEELGVPENVAIRYRDGVNNGGVLLWIKTDDERASLAANRMRAENGQDVAEFGH